MRSGDAVQERGVKVHVLSCESGAGERLDRFLVRQLQDLTRSQIKRLITSGQVWLNGERAKAGAQLRPCDRVEVHILPSPASSIQPQPIPLKIIHQDSWIVVLDKPPGMVVHPGAGHHSGTLVHALLAHWPALEALGGPKRAGLVHRLDKDTSGVLVVAKTEKAHQHLARQFRERTVEKHYLSLVHGRVRESAGTVRLPLGRDPGNRKLMSTRSRRPRAAVTHWRVIAWLPHTSLLAVTPETGRTHQIRVHLNAIGHPVVGDPVYGSRARSRQVSREDIRRAFLGVTRQLLHAGRLSFEHPDGRGWVTFSSPIPSDLLEILVFLGFEPGGNLTFFPPPGYNI